MSTMIVKPYHGITHDGFTVNIESAGINQTFVFGDNASYSESFATDEKPFVADVLKQFVEEHGIDHIDVEPSANHFDGDKKDTLEDLSWFTGNYIDVDEKLGALLPQYYRKHSCVKAPNTDGALAESTAQAMVALSGVPHGTALVVSDDAHKNTAYVFYPEDSLKFSTKLGNAKTQLESMLEDVKAGKFKTYGININSGLVSDVSNAADFLSEALGNTNIALDTCEEYEDAGETLCNVTIPASMTLGQFHDVYGYYLEMNNVNEYTYDYDIDFEDAVVEDETAPTPEAPEADADGFRPVTPADECPFE